MRPPYPPDRHRQWSPYIMRTINLDCHWFQAKLRIFYLPRLTNLTSGMRHRLLNFFSKFRFRRRHFSYPVLLCWLAANCTFGAVHYQRCAPNQDCIWRTHILFVFCNPFVCILCRIYWQQHRNWERKKKKKGRKERACNLCQSQNKVTRDTSTHKSEKKNGPLLIDSSSYGPHVLMANQYRSNCWT